MVHPITLPQIAGEWEEHGGNLNTARMRFGYNGALVHDRNQALREIGEADLPGHTIITTLIIEGSTLDLFAHYAENAQYHQRIVCGTSLTRLCQGFCQGYRMLRNA